MHLQHIAKPSLTQSMRATRSTVSTTRSGKKRASSPLLSGGTSSANPRANKKRKTNAVDDTDKTEEEKGKVGGTGKRGKANEKATGRKTRSVHPTSLKLKSYRCQSLQEENIGYASQGGCQCCSSFSPYEVSFVFRYIFLFLPNFNRTKAILVGSGIAVAPPKRAKATTAHSTPLPSLPKSSRVR